MLFILWFLGPMINVNFFSDWVVIRHPVFYNDYAFHKFLNLVFSPGREEIELSIISITVKANPMFLDDISQG